MSGSELSLYSTVVLNLRDLCDRHRLADGRFDRSRHSWYLYRQSFYGFVDYLDWRECCLASRLAVEEYRKVDPQGNIRARNWSDQGKFDSGRQNGIFHLEHVYSGDMFRSALEGMSPEARTAERVAELVRANYRVAWILKSENKLLPKQRGATLADALRVYREAGVLID